MISREQKLTPDFEVLLTIYEQTVVMGDKITEKDLRELLKDENWLKNQVSLSVERLYDKGMIERKWAFVKPQTWGYCVFIDERFMGFTTGLYNAVQNVEEKKESKQVVDDIKNRAKNKKAETKEDSKDKKPEIKKSEKENEFK